MTERPPEVDPADVLGPDDEPLPPGPSADAILAGVAKLKRDGRWPVKRPTPASDDDQGD